MWKTVVTKVRKVKMIKAERREKGKNKEKWK